MKTLQFKCTLLSDVILNVKAATEGNNNTLDFIPGNNFLGIVAKEYDKFSEQKQIEIFHSGKVRFGDAHPVEKKHESIRSLHIPASMYYQKLEPISNVCYIHHFHDYKKDAKTVQLKQCRSGYYAFIPEEDGTKGIAFPASASKTFAIKSAYDREMRRSEDEKMYGYQSLRQNQSFLFEVECDNDDLAEEISKCLIGEKHIGRSRTAQYGLVKIEKAEFENIKGSKAPFNIGSKQYIAVYAEGRLIFLDDEGIPTFQPTPEALGIKDKEAKIDWQKSQIRTFQYAPWNYQRQCRDTDRCGIEKGSVFIVETKDPVESDTAIVGAYLNEGFGKVIYNPAFLNAIEGKNGFVTYKVPQREKGAETERIEPVNPSSLLKYLMAKCQQEKDDEEIMDKVNTFVKDNVKKLTRKTSASQWGQIRSIAMSNTKEADIMEKLFGVTNEGFDKEKGYLTHGVASDDWKDCGGLTKLKRVR